MPVLEWMVNTSCRSGCSRWARVARNVPKKKNIYHSIEPYVSGLDPVRPFYGLLGPI